MIIKKVNPYGYYDKALKQYFHTERQKKQWLKKHNYVEDKNLHNEKKTVHKAIEEINGDRERRGQKPLSSSHILGNSYASRYLRKSFIFSNNPLAKRR